MAKNIDSKMAITFINLTGIDIDCWLDAEDYFNYEKKRTKETNINENNNNNKKKKKKFTLKGDNKNENNIRNINKLDLIKLYSKLPETQIKIKKDKFSFQIKGYIPITGNDFSSNYSSSFKLKRDKKQKIEDNSDVKTKDIKTIDNIIKDDPIKDNDLEENLLINNEENDNIISTSTKKNLNLNINEDLEILVKIRQNGNLKSIVFESNIFFFNNLQIPISLSLISNNDFTQKYDSSDEKIEHMQNNNKIIIKTGMKKSIPIAYINNKYRMYISFHNQKDEKKNNYSLLYANLTN